MNYLIETERLILREWIATDAQFVFQLLNSDTWKKYLGNRNINQLSEAEYYMNNHLQAGIKENGFGFWCLSLKESNEPIGMMGFVKRPWLMEMDFGFALHPHYERKGYAFEMARVLLPNFIKQHGLQYIQAITLPDNERSIQLLKQLHFSYHQFVHDPQTNERLEVYQVDFKSLL